MAELAGTTIVAGASVRLDVDPTPMRRGFVEARREAEQVERKPVKLRVELDTSRLTSDVARVVNDAQRAVKPVVVPVQYQPVFGGPGAGFGSTGVMGAGQFSTIGGGGGNGGLLGGGYASGGSAPVLTAPGTGASPPPLPGGQRPFYGPQDKAALRQGFKVFAAANAGMETIEAGKALTLAFAEPDLDRRGPLVQQAQESIRSAGFGAGRIIDWAGRQQYDELTTIRNLGAYLAPGLAKRLGLPAGGLGSDEQLAEKTRREAAKQDAITAMVQQRAEVGAKTRLADEVKLRQMTRAEQLVGQSRGGVAFSTFQNTMEDFERTQEETRRQTGKGDTDEVKAQRNLLRTSGMRGILDAYKADQKEKEQITADSTNRIRQIAEQGEQSMMRAVGQTRRADIASLRSDMRDKIKEYEDAQRALKYLPSTATPNERAAAQAAVTNAGAAVGLSSTQLNAGQVAATREAFRRIGDDIRGASIANLRGQRRNIQADREEFDQRQFEESREFQGNALERHYFQRRQAAQRRAFMQGQAFEENEFQRSMSGRQEVAGLVGKGRTESASIIADAFNRAAELRAVDPTHRAALQQTLNAELNAQRALFERQATMGARATTFDPKYDVIGEPTVKEGAADIRKGFDRAGQIINDAGGTPAAAGDPGVQTDIKNFASKSADFLGQILQFLLTNGLSGAPRLP